MLKDENGAVIGPDSDNYEALGIGEMIGGPFEDTAGPALNNFIKFVAVFALVTEKLYDPTPENSWPKGFMCIAGSIALILFSKFGLTLALNCITSFLKQRHIQKGTKADEDEDEDLFEDEEAAVDDAFADE